MPDVSGGKTIVEGKSLSCVFRLEGEAGRSVSSRCEDASGAAIDCGSSSPMQLQPFGSNKLPVKDGLFIMSTARLGSGKRTVVWVADDGEHTARYRLEVNIVPDDGVNGAPGVEFNCGGDTDGSVRVSAGAQLTCTVRFVDPDPDTLSWSYALASGSTPQNEATPFGGSGQTPHEVVWRWSTQASEAGKTWTYAFTVNDGTAPAVTRNLTVSVE
ncbi:hypothetical protein [Archangium sp. Cb G35]|uniref:hypothetical protein n=1 Tax=Archangium sp. Cb G35 TaxID=1920190 RepID=UPI00116111B1|nr:hypothetical protein [Archangium sp. Cb G35]